MNVHVIGLEFWEQVYVAAIRAGNSPEIAGLYADKALKSWKEKKRL